MKRISKEQLIKLSVFISVIIHTVGVFGISSEHSDLFLSTTPFVLILSSTLLFINFNKLTRALLVLFTISATIGYLAELTGVHTGFLFGNYYYGDTLGLKIFGVPLTIALNWASLCIAASSIISGLKTSKITKVALAGVLPVFVDILMEPLVHKLDFWFWSGGEIPISNYITWYSFSLLFCSLFIFSEIELKNAFAKYYLLIQILFFLTLNLILNL